MVSVVSAQTFGETPRVNSAKRMLVMSVAGLVGGVIGFLLSKIPDGTAETEAQLRTDAGFTFMLMVAAIGAALIIGNSILDGHPPSGELLAIAAVALLGLGFASGYIAQTLYSSMINDSDLARCVIVDEFGFEQFDSSCYISVIRLARTVGWGLAGALGGVGIGLSFRSRKRLQNAVIGGAVGGLIGGFLFDLIPQILETDSPDTPRLVAVTIIGVLIGVLIAAIDAVRSDMFLEVMSGEMRGRQFLVMDQTTRVGSARSAGVVLLADREIAEVHLTIQRAPNGVSFTCNTTKPVMLNGAPASSGWLSSGDILRVGNTDVRVGFKKATAAGGISQGVVPHPDPQSVARPTASSAAAGTPEYRPAAQPARQTPSGPRPGASSVPPPPASRPRIPTKPQ